MYVRIRRYRCPEEGRKTVVCKIPDFACDVVGLDNTQAATTATEHLVEKGFEALLFLSEPLGSVNTRRERLSAFRATLQRYAGIVAENAEVPLNDGAMLDTVLRQFHSRHRGMRKALISANGALTLQVARALKRIDLVIHLVSVVATLNAQTDVLDDVALRNAVESHLHFLPDIN